MENISDAELRQRLLAKGFDAPPVTDTSRALLIKKLKKLDSSKTPAGASRAGVSPSRAAATSRPVAPAASSRPVAPAASSRPVVPAVDQYDGKARRTRQTERSRDSSPEILLERYVPEPTPHPQATPSPPRSTRSSRKEASVDRIDMMASSIKNSTPYADASFAKGTAGGGDPFEKGSDSDDSLYAASRGAGSSRYLARKPIGLRRESEFFTAPSAYRKYDAHNGASMASKSARYGRAGASKPLSARLSWRMVTPTLVLGTCLVFFAVVAAIYYSKNDRTYGDLSVDALEQPRCSVRPGAGVPCIPDDEVPSAIDYLRMLYRALHRRKLAAVCQGAGDVNEGRLSDDEVAEMFLLETGRLRHECEKTVKHLRVLVAVNPQLRITWSVEDGFDLVDPSLPWRCVMRIWFSWLWEYVLYGVATIALVVSMQILVSWATHRRKAQANEKRELIKGILEILQQHAAAHPAQSYLPIVHVRDQLIAYADRDRKRRMWAEAQRYIEENESRVRKEVQPFEGEDYDVWRWVGSAQQSAPKPKTWQGEAFETSKDTMNTPSTSPTPCLKIRHMFEPDKEPADQDWGTGVKDAILERCEGVHIVHMVVEENSPEGCVYIKCASTDDAGKAYRKIHGAWFDGKIVTVKFLRLERYHERFPASVGLSKPLIPSNDQKRSLA